MGLVSFNKSEMINDVMEIMEFNDANRYGINWIPMTLWNLWNSTMDLLS